MVKSSDTSINSGTEEFLDIQTGMVMSREEFIEKINNGEYPGYYVASSIGEDQKSDEHM